MTICIAMSFSKATRRHCLYGARFHQAGKSVELAGNDRQQGYEALAIPHNGNASNGLMYDWLDSDGQPIDRIMRSVARRTSR